MDHGARRDTPLRWGGSHSGCTVPRARPRCDELHRPHLPPDAVYADSGFDGAAAADEAAEHSPGIAETLEPDSPGMHTTPTIDYNVVLDGEVWLELSDGAEVRLVAGDVVVQHGARHAWRNKSDRSATIAAILIGAQRVG